MNYKLITFMLALASMMYEYCLSHVLSILYGNLVAQYIITTGLFIFFLGLGSLYFEKKLKDNKNFKLYKLEFLLSFLGSICVIFPFLIESLISVPSISQFLCYSLIAMIAFLSGIELPALIHLSKKNLETLGFDYLGMCIAGFLFAMITLPYIGLLETSFLIGSINFYIALYIYNKENKNFKRNMIFCIFPIGLFFLSPMLNSYLTGVFIGQ